MELQAEAKYFCIEAQAAACEASLSKTGWGRGAGAGINANNMVVVKLLINRHDNKYSYTGASDDNLLKNIELFDKLSLRFSNRVLFIKDVIGSNEICCWSFYGHGKKIAEVCCTAIVYATDRKNTKVEFPEARIYEETLNCLLYENRIGPDQDLMQATSSKNAVASYTSDDETDERNRLGGGGGGGEGGGGHGGGGGAGGGAAGVRGHGSGLGRLRSTKNN